jgi:hypothetical protein
MDPIEWLVERGPSVHDFVPRAEDARQGCGRFPICPVVSAQHETVIRAIKNTEAKSIDVTSADRRSAGGDVITI